jgi:hypothetical protein
LRSVLGFGIGEVPRRILAEAILTLLQPDIVDASGPLQVCAGQDSECETAVHAMRHAFHGKEVDGVDATNAFNSINRQTALHNISAICPSPLHNTYHVIPGSGEVSSSEDTT